MAFICKRKKGSKPLWDLYKSATLTLLLKFGTGHPEKMTGIFGKLVTVISLPIQFIWMDHQREIVAVGKKQFTLCIHMRVLSENDMFTKNLMVHHYIPIFVQAKN